MNVAITGITGTVGTVVARKLEQNGHKIIGLGRSFGEEQESICDECYSADLTTVEGRETANEAFEDAEVVFHLAWNIPVENFDTGERWEGNMDMYKNVIDAATNQDVDIFINGSSIHAGTGDIPAYTAEASLENTPEPYKSSIDPRTDYRLKEEAPDKLLSPQREKPDSPYGESKIETENILEKYVNDGDFRLGVSIRIGGITEDDATEQEGEPYFESLYLSHKTICRVIEAILDSQESGYHQIYAVSDNPGRIFSLENDLGWEPIKRST